ncbi:MAG: three-Cys-motif partner protein TcmP [Bacteroidetes bacterium]|jgi:three-Cys-motif partner protein|nr:three-Cys-motif partner protein TcmP [Bacteroidota bacterium]MBT3750170.1 three-Cys-motif partner protein TcmP [Bacteroidota bacterium]MBT4399625.1 three-Cys-motif partner protein TcmP [Bacteroidota bacterium]MBT7093923.1 three-Cys-motif partner protein TcmP [Bacteroidota bacterium]MBT7462530.1 three-Cys-motif partner protein TcmP [Bacteroidota bacterium]
MITNYFGTTHHECDGNCNKIQRVKYLENGICTKVVAGYDGGPIRCVKTWANEKIHLLTRYFDIFATGMKDKWAGNINYIEICSGPGICLDKDNSKEILGAPLAISQMRGFEYINRAIFIDMNPLVVDNLNKRFQNFGIDDRALAMLGDYNQHHNLLNSLNSIIARKGLNLLFIDPTDCSVPFTTVSRLLSSLNKCDLILSVMYGSDPKRNMQRAFDEPKSRVRQKYSDFLGSNDFFENDENLELANQGRHDQLHRNFIDFYIGQLKTFEYLYFDCETVRHMYELLFASKNETGQEFWKEATKKKLYGQRKLF